MSSTGQIVGGVVGAVVGYFVGNPVLGAQIGMTIGGLVDPPKTLGPRLNDLTAQTSTYGAFIPRIYGTAPVVGNIFWIQGNALIERKADGGGKGGPTVTNFEYFATFAVGLCEGPISGVRRIWIGGQLWYDGGAGDMASIIASNASATGFTLYPGSDTQLADPLIQADHGVSNVPAYRGLAYIVFNELPLKGYGNSLAAAQVKVEVVKAGVISNALTRVSSTGLGGGVFPSSIYVKSNFAYVVNQTETRMRIYDLFVPESPRLMGSVVLDFVPVDVVTDGTRAYVSNYGSGKIQVIDVLNKSSPVVTGSVIGANNPTSLYLVFPHLYSLSATSNVLQVFDVIDPVNPRLVSTTATGLNPRKIRVVDGFAYVLNADSNTLQVFNVLNKTAPLSVFVIATDSSPYGLTIHGNTAFVTHNSSTTIKSYDITTPSAVLLNSTTTMRAPSRDATIILDQLFVLSTDANLSAYDIKDPASPILLVETDFGTNASSVSNDGVLSWLVDSYEDTMVSVLYSRSVNSNAVLLSSIVQSECLKSDLLTAADLDVTDLTDQVRGYRVSSLAPLRGGIDPLRKAWPFDAIQHGYKIKFKRRGGASVATITEGELDARAAGASPGVQIANTREMDLVLPKQLTAQYLDATREYDVNVAEESRQ